MIRVPCICLSAAFLLLSAAGPSAAAQAFTLRPGISFDSSKAITEAVVPYGDIDPASPAGARALLDRIEAAAEAVCAGALTSATRDRLADYRDCRRAAVSDAVARTRSPVLTELASRGRTERRAAW